MKRRGVWPIPRLFTSNCACDPFRFCLFHYGRLTRGEQRLVRQQLGIRDARR